MMLNMAETETEKTDDQAIGERVKAARKDVDQVDLAQQMKDLGYKWSQATVWAVEKGRRSLKLAEARDLADLLGVSLLDLVGFSSESDDAVAVLRKIRARTETSRKDALECIGEWMMNRTGLESMTHQSRKRLEGEKFTTLRDQIRAEVEYSTDDLIRDGNQEFEYLVDAAIERGKQVGRRDHGAHPPRDVLGLGDVPNPAAGTGDDAEAYLREHERADRGVDQETR